MSNQLSPQKILFSAMLFFVVLALQAYAANLHCTSCATCTGTISGASQGDVIYLDNSISNIGYTCINFSGKDGITLDCQGNTIDGSGQASTYAIYLSPVSGGSNHTAIQNCIITDFNEGIRLQSSNYNDLAGITVSGAYNGIYMQDNTGTSISDVVMDDNSNGIYLDNSSYNNIEGTSFSDNAYYGIRLFSDSDYNRLSGITIAGNGIAGIFLDEASSDDPEYNIFFDNYLNNTACLLMDTGIAGENYFNTTIDCTEGPNIIGGSCMGGNFWAVPSSEGFSETCIDTGLQLGICDDYYDLGSGTSSAFDLLPLNFLDQTGPVVSGLSNSTTNETADITFATDDPANHTLEYGTDSSMGEAPAINPGHAAAHTVNLTGLINNTQYYFNITACNYDGYCSESGPYAFTTSQTLDTGAPVQSSISHGTPGHDSANITWTTNEAVRGIVKYRLSSGTAGIYPYHSTLEGTYSTSHTRALTGLSGSTVYYYVVNSTDASGNSVQSSERSFTTDATPDTTAPTVTIASPATNTATVSTNRNILLSVTTNEDSECYVDASKLGSASATTTDYTLGSNQAGTVHTRYFNATGDSSGYDNYFTVICTDSSNNSASATRYFKLNDTTAPIITFHSPTPVSGSYRSNPNATINMTVNDYPVTVKVSFDNATNVTLTVSGGAYSLSKINLAERLHDFYIYVTDAKSNLNIYYRKFTVDMTEPELDIVSPDDGGTVSSCMDVVLNVTSNEEAECEYTLSFEDLELYNGCMADCDRDYERCTDRADTSTERTYCRNESRECEDDCEDDRYQEEDSDYLEEDWSPYDCTEDCDDDFDDCDDECKDDKATCLASAADSDDRESCNDNYDDCYENCQDDQEECNDECFDEGYSYTMSFDECFSNGNYMVRYYCLDLADNEIEENITFRLVDTVPPVVTAALPNTTQTGYNTRLQVITDENSVCKFSNANLGFESMLFTFTGTAKAHTYTLPVLSKGNYTYYVLCSDTSGNIMSSPEIISFYVSGTGAATDSGTGGQNEFSRSSMHFDLIEAGIPAIFSVDKDDIALLDMTIETNEDVPDVDFDVEETIPAKAASPDAGKVYQYFNINKEGISNKQISKVLLKFRVRKTWLDSNGIGKDSVILSRYETSWEDMAADRVSEDSSYVYYLSEMDHLSTFAVLGKKISGTEVPAPDINENSGQKESPADGDSTKSPDTDEPKEIADDAGVSWMIWIIVIVCVLVVGGGSAGFIYAKSHRHPQQEDSPAGSESHETLKEAAFAGSHPGNADDAAAAASLSHDDELSRYISESLSTGFGPDDVRNALLDAGYTPEDVDSKFMSMGLISGDAPASFGFPQAQDEGDGNSYGPAGSESGIADAGGSGEIYAGEDYEGQPGAEDTAGGAYLSDGEAAQPEDGYYGWSGQDSDGGQEGQGRTDDIEGRLAQYIISALSSGMTVSDVAESLISAGYGRDYIGTIMDHYVPEGYRTTDGAGAYGYPDYGSVNACAGDGGKDHQAGQTGDIENDLSRQVGEYIGASLSSGCRPDDIRAALVSAGHDPGFVDSILIMMMSKLKDAPYQDARRQDALLQGALHVMRPEQQSAQQPGLQQQNSKPSVQPSIIVPSSGPENHIRPNADGIPVIDKGGLDEITVYMMDALGDKIPRGPIKKALMRAGHPQTEIDAKFRWIDDLDRSLQSSLEVYAGLEAGKGMSKKDIKKKLISSGIDKKLAKSAVKKIR